MVDYKVSSYVIICYLCMFYLQLMMFGSNDDNNYLCKIKTKESLYSDTSFST